jgi:hypothetical protein
MKKIRKNGKNPPPQNFGTLRWNTSSKCSKIFGRFWKKSCYNYLGKKIPKKMEHFEKKSFEVFQKKYLGHIYVKIPNIYIYIDVGRKPKMESYM